MARNHKFPASLFFILAGFLWASFIVLGILANYYKGHDYQLLIVIMALLDLITAVFITIAATIFWLIDKRKISAKTEKATS